MKSTFVLPLLFWGVAGHSAVALAQSSGTFTATGNMITPRYGHTATLLPNGKVLIAGAAWPLVSAEIYDPQTGTFSSTGDMTVPLAQLAATLLPNGQVLIVGVRIVGVNVDNSWVRRLEAEIYDPATGTFSPAGNVDNPQVVCAVATSLIDGKVLVGVGTWSPPAGALGVPPYLYDPTSATFAATGQYATEDNLDEGVCPTDVLLADGKVLTTWESWKAEIYTPATGTYLPTGDLTSTGSEGYTGTLLTNGSVLIAGGDTNPINSLYDPAKAKFTTTGNMKTTRGGHTATLLPDGTVLVAGGYYAYPQFGLPSTLSYPTRAELYQPDMGTFTQTGNMASRFGHTATLLADGTVLIAGGISNLSLPPIASAEIYHPVVMKPAPALLSLSGDGKGQGAIQHASTFQLVTADNPAVAGEIIVIYCSGLIDGSVIPPQVTIGGHMAEILYFGNAPGFTALNQVNVRVPSGVTPGLTVSVRLTYLARPSNEVTIGVR